MFNKIIMVIILCSLFTLSIVAFNNTFIHSLEPQSYLNSKYVHDQIQAQTQILYTSNGVCNVLALSGGGSFGAVEIGILKNINLDYYDIITGVSVGGLNTAVLSYFNSKYNNSLNLGIDELIQLYSTITNDNVYEHDYLDMYKDWAYYSTRPLRKTLYSTLNKYSYVIGAQNHLTLIGSTNLNKGSFEMFDFNSYVKSDQIEILMASTAIPIIFPPNIINSTYYVDGATISNQILIGLNEKIKCKYYNITYIGSHQKINQIKTINSFADYVKRLFDVVSHTFDDQISILNNIKCQYPSGKIYYYYPDDSKLEKYSILDMNHGAELIDIGSKYHFMEIIDYCL
jgi:predicted patatin/cPLA2 family phospholipase